MTKALARRVRQERERHVWSVRQAAQRGGTSNTTWSKFENNGEVRDAITRAVAKAFDWPNDWPEHPPPLSPRAEPASTATRLDALEAQVAELNQARRELAPQILANANSLTALWDELHELARDVRPLIDPTPDALDIPPGLAP